MTSRDSFVTLSDTAGTYVHDTSVLLLSSRYEYKPLSVDCRFIRLLSVNAVEVDEAPDSQLQGTLEHVELDKAPPFHALSYTWGAVSDQATVLVCDHDGDHLLPDCLTITRNCYEALLSLRERLGDFRIWIDAVCINQDDDEEKASQIPLMGEIYSRASHVYVWLGSGNKATSRAMECLDYIKEPELFSRCPPPNDLRSRLWRFHRKNIIAMKLDVFWPWRFVRCLVYLRPKSFKLILKVHKQIPTIFPGSGYQRKHCVQASEFQELLSTPWIQRIWTYQEILLARSPVLVRGRDHLSWDNFALGILTLNIANLPMKVQSDLSLDGWIRIVLDRENFLWKLQQCDDPVQTKQYCPMLDYRTTMRNMPRRSMCIHFLFALILLCSTIRRKRQTCPVGECHGFEVSPIAILLIFVSVLIHWILYRFQDKWTPPCQEVDGLVYAALTRQATKEKDYHNGIRCCIAASQGQPAQRIDPTLPESAMHHDLALQLLKATSCGHILVAAAVTSAASCPSWVPDWTYVWPKPFDIYEESGPNWRHDGATHGSKMDVVLGIRSSGTIAIRGKVIAEVRSIYHDFDRLSITRKVKLSRSLLEKFRISRNCDSTDHSRCKNHEECLRKANPEQATYERMRYECQMLLKYQRHPYLPCWERQQPITPELKAWAEYSNCVVEGNWCLFDAVEVSNAYEGGDVWDVGCAKDSIQVGDQVVLFTGVTTPLVVRPVDGKYELMSPARRLDEAMTGFYWNPFQVTNCPYLELC